MTRRMRYRWCPCCGDGAVDPNRRKLVLGAALAGLAAAAGGLPTISPALAQGSLGPREAPRSGNYIIKSAYVVPMHPGAADLPRGDIHIRNGEIAAIGENLASPGAEIIDGGEMIAMPGFVETHWHLWNTTLKNMIRKGAEYFPLKQAFARHFTPEDFYIANRLALAEAVDVGMTSVHNFAHNTRSPAHVDAELRALQESGLGGRYSYGWIDPIPDTEVMSAADVARVKRDWFGASSPFKGAVDLGVAVRGPMYTKREIYEAEIKAARELGLPIVMHIGQNKRRYTSCAQLREEGLLDASTILVHGQVQTEKDRDAIADTKASVSVSIQSELRSQEDGDIREQMLLMLAKNINICCSVDSDALGSTSMFEAMSTIWYLGIPWRGTASEKLPPIDFRQALQMATINGARAFGAEARTGSLAVGKRADVILIRASDLNMAPVGEIDGTLVRSATVANVDTVIAGGKVLKRGGELLGIDVKAIKADAVRSLHQLRQKAGGAWAPKTNEMPRF